MSFVRAHLVAPFGPLRVVLRAMILFSVLASGRICGVDNGTRHHSFVLLGIYPYGVSSEFPLLWRFLRKF